MATVKQALENWTELSKMFEILAVDAMYETADEAIKLNVEQLYDFGIKSTGEIVTPDYTPLTVSIKRRKGQITDHVTLKDTGAFHKSFNAKRITDGIEIDATDSKREKLVEKYSGSIFGLADGSKKMYKDFLKPQLLLSIRKLLNYK